MTDISMIESEFVSHKRRKEHDIVPVPASTISDINWFYSIFKKFSRAKQGRPDTKISIFCLPKCHCMLNASGLCLSLIADIGSGSIYSYYGNPRTTALLAVAKANALDVDMVDVKPGDDKLLEKFPLGKLPGFVGADGFMLHECNAIAIYCKFFQ